MELTQITICYFDDIGTLHAIMDVSPANHTVLLELGEEILTMTTLKLLKLHDIDLSEPRDLLQNSYWPSKGRAGHKCSTEGIARHYSRPTRPLRSIQCPPKDDRQRHMKEYVKTNPEKRHALRSLSMDEGRDSCHLDPEDGYRMERKP